MKSFSLIPLLAAIPVVFGSTKCPPLRCTKGVIGVRFDNHTSLGFISEHFMTDITTGISGIDLYTTGKKNPLKVSLPSKSVKTVLSKTAFDITTSNGPVKGRSFLGGVGGVIPLAPGSSGFVTLSAVEKVPVGPPSLKVGVTAAHGESAIFKLACDLTLTPSWINADNSSSSAQFFAFKYPIGPSPGLKLYGNTIIGLTGDLAALQKYAGTTTRLARVTLQFVPEC